MKRLPAYTTLLLAICVQASWADGFGYATGEKVEYKPNQFQDIWEQGIVVKAMPETTPGLKQLLIRSIKPSPYNPKAFDEVCYSIEHVRHLNEKTGGAPVNAKASSAQPKFSATLPPSLQNTTVPGQRLQAPVENKAHAGTVSVLFGKWSTLMVGHTVNYAPGDGWIYRKNEIGAHDGTLTINPDHTYVWNSVSQGSIKGTWRDATAAELSGGYPGPGIRILKGENGWDYSVTKRPGTTAAGDSICIWTSGYQVNGYKM